MNARSAVATEGPEQLVFKQFPDNLKDQARKLWERRREKLDRLLEQFPPDQRHLRIVFDENQHHKRLYDVHAVLALPTATLVADAQAYDPKLIDAVDRVADQLEKEIIRHKGLLRHDYLYKRKRRRLEDQDLAGLRPMLEAHRRNDQREQFIELLRPVVQGLETYARHELIVAQFEGAIGPNEVTVSDLLDEVLVRAWNRFKELPIAKPLEQWLTQILHEVVDEKRSKSQRAESIQGKVSGNDPRFEADAGSGTDTDSFWQQAEPLLLEQVLRDEEAPETWQRLAAVERRRLILAELASYSPEQRRAFMLHALQGWDIDDIASVQGRSPEQVRVDIDGVRLGLRRRLEKLVEPSRQGNNTSPS